jgi:alpha-glucosidase (family GH31 glycosyl hydrolase)
MGFNVWGSDTGGYHQGFNRETTARWLAFSAFCPLMEVGPTGNRGLWNAPWDPGYDGQLIAIWSLYAQVHDRLGDYLYECAKHATATGEPIVRPLTVQYPYDFDARRWWDEYLLGEDILVCPVWKSDVRSREVYLPEGEWIDAWRPASTFEGPQNLTMDCPLHKIPVFVRKGSGVDLGDLNETYTEALERAEKKPNMADLLKKAGLDKFEE